MNQKQTLCLVALAGLLTGAALDRLIFTKTNTFGTLYFDESDEEKDSYTIEIDDLDTLPNKKHVLLKVTRIAQKNQSL